MTLSEAVRGLVAGRPGTFGVYARNLVTDETIGVNADRVLPAESAAKTFILVHYSRLVTSGAVDPRTRVRLGQDLRFIGTGVLRYLADGLEPTLDDLAWLMIIVSDNTATAMLLQAIGEPADVNATMATLGYPTARLTNPSPLRPLSRPPSKASGFRRVRRVISPRCTPSSTSVPQPCSSASNI